VAVLVVAAAVSTVGAALGPRQALSEDCGGPEPDPVELIVVMEAAATAEDVAAMKEVNGEGAEALVAPPDLWVVQMPAGLSLGEAVARYEALPGVQYAGADSQMRLEASDPGSGCPEIGAGLDVGLSDNPDPVFAGGTLVYEVTVRNAGPDEARNVELTSAVPRDARLLSSGFSNGDAKGSCPPGADGVVRCEIGDLAVDGTATLRMEVRPKEPGLLAAVVDAQADNALMGVDSSASASTRVLEAPTTRLGPCTVTGTAGSDLLVGTGGRDVVCGLGGDDTLLGAGGDDAIFGGPGDDLLRGGSGSDELVGGWGADELRARDSVRGNDTVRGGPGTDVVIADRGDRVTE
jgi:uncharacterized repeat protein (TIGR01451 family)